MSQSLFTSQTPSTTDAADGGAAGISTATTVRFTAAGVVSGIRFFSTVTVGGTYTAELWHVTAADTSPAGTLLASKVGGTPSSGGWNVITFDSPVSVATANLYRAVINNSQGRYVALSNVFASFVSNGDIIGDSDQDNPIGLGTLRQGTFKDNSAAGVYPSISGNKTCYFADVVFDTGSTFALGRVAETDTARALAVTKTVALGRTTESDSARSLTLTKSVALGRVATTEAMRPLALAKTIALGRITETDIARGLTVSQPGIEPVGATAPITATTRGGLIVSTTRGGVL